MGESPFFYQPQFGLRSPPFYSGYSPQRFFQPGCRPKIHCFTQVCFVPQSGYTKVGWGPLLLVLDRGRRDKNV